jgi:hypothetical protein
MLHLLQQGHPMLKYEALKLLKGEIVAPDHYYFPRSKTKGQGRYLLIHKRTTLTNLFYYSYSSSK